MSVSLPIVRDEFRARQDNAFNAALSRHAMEPLSRARTTTLQINVGKLCNQACLHCHVEAGPKRTEIMSGAVADRVLSVLASSQTIGVVDFTGGAPELNAEFRRMVREARSLGHGVIDRCNLTVMFEPGMEWLPAFLADNEVRVTASLPCYSLDNVDKQRGKGVFEKSIAGLGQLNELGYGRADSGLALDLVYNPLGAFLPPSQADLEPQYKQQLRDRFGIEFNRLLTLTNLPVSRFADQLRRDGAYDGYMDLLQQSFNASTVSSVMCRSLVSVGYDGSLYDCDFNQMLELGLGLSEERRAPSVWDIESFDEFEGRRIATGPHCLGCTAGAGSSCGGSLDS